MNRQKLDAHRELARAKSFMLVTDRISIMSIVTTKFKDLNSMVSIASQRGSLVRFRDNISEMLKSFDAKFEKANKPKTTNRVAKKK